MVLELVVRGKKNYTMEYLKTGVHATCSLCLLSKQKHSARDATAEPGSDGGH